MLLVVVGVIAAITACGGAEPQDADFVAGRTVFRGCAACHGTQGEGGAGPPLTGVLETFPSCDDHVRWITLGSQRWVDEVGPSYGTQGKPVGGAMPSHEDTLSETELRQIAMYERVRFGESDIGTEKTACGLGSGAGGG